jgi:hypothetical protein
MLVGRLIGDHVAEFVAGRCVVDPDAMVDGDELRAAYRDWAASRGEEALPPAVFGSRLRAGPWGVGKSRLRRGEAGRRRRFYMGICLIKHKGNTT